MILGFSDNGLKRLYEQDDESRIPPEWARRVRRIIERLDEATQPGDMNVPGWRLHKLTGGLKDHWSVRVSANWRITFRFESGRARDVNLIDYH